MEKNQLLESHTKPCIGCELGTPVTNGMHGTGNKKFSCSNASPDVAAQTRQGLEKFCERFYRPAPCLC